MKALVYTEKEQLTYKEVQMPEPKKGEVLIKIDSVGICGSDMHAYLGHDARRPAPLILGHEVSGTIESGSKKGQKVAINPLVTCGDCSFCNHGQENLCPSRQIISMPPREGAFAEWICMPEVNLVDLPSDFPLQSAALIEPIACGWHAIKLALNAIKTENAFNQNKKSLEVLVIGGGAVGFGSVLSLDAMAIEQTIPIKQIIIAEPSKIRRQYLSSRSNHLLIDPEAIKPNCNFDIVIDAAGFEATRAMASNQVRPGGVIVHIGLGSAIGGLDIRRMTLQEIQFIGSYTYSAKDFRDTAKAVIDRRINELSWIEIRELSAGEKAFNDIRGGKLEAPKIILKPNIN